MIDHLAIAKAAAEALKDKRAVDVCLLKVNHLTDLADYYLISTAKNQPHINAQLQAVDHVLAQLQVEVLHSPGPRQSSWRLLDCGWLVVHIFLPEERQYYNLERLWYDGTNQIELPDPNSEEKPAQ